MKTSDIVPESDIRLILEDLLSREHLSRSRAHTKLLTSVNNLNSEQSTHIRNTLIRALDSDDERWEGRCGALIGLKVMIENENKLCEKNGGTEEDGEEEWDGRVVECCLGALVKCREVRERRVAGEVLGVIAGREGRGMEIWGRCRKELLKKVWEWMEMGRKQRLEEKAEGVRREIGVVKEDSNEDDYSIGKGLMHETEGWRGLETGLLAIGKMIDGCGTTCVRNTGVAALDEVIECCMKAGEHENRFVREASLIVLTSVVEAVREADAGDDAGLPKRVVGAIKKGLDDNWSQVRYVASVAVRTLLESCTMETKRDLYPILMQRMCLNRHYVAEGVRNYSQATWRKVIGEDGRLYLEKLLPKVVAYYQSQCGANNHAVREAACQSLAEAATRLNPDAVKPLVPTICDALMDCFKDESWPVRDHACLALSKIAKTFPKRLESTKRLEELYELFEGHLADNIPSVRSNTAMALVDASRGFSREHPVMGADCLIRTAQKLLNRMPEQKEHEGLKKLFAKDPQYGAAHKVARDNDEELHTGQIRYSCGSLAPKLRRGGGCMDHGFTRAKEPWEETDGGMKLLTCLIRESRDELRESTTVLFPLAFEAARVAAGKRFAQSTTCLYSLWSEIEECVRIVNKEFWTPEVLDQVVPLINTAAKCGFERVERIAERVTRSVISAAGAENFERAQL